MPGNTVNHVLITPDDHGPILAIVTWFFMTMMIFAAIFRLIIKLFVRRRLEFDDYTVCVALLFGVAQSIVISVSLRDGLGKRKDILSSQNLTSIEQTLYAADLLFIMACGMAKVSILMLVRRLVVSKMHRLVSSISIGVVIAWMIASFLALALQCGASHPWASQTGKCINKFVFWVAISPIDIITELVVMTLPIFMIIPIQLIMSKKVAVVLAFAFRIGVLILIIIRLCYLHSYYHAPDFVLDFVTSGVATQALISVSITTACVPALKPFLDSFDSGALNVEIKRSTGNGLNSYELQQSKGQSRIKTNTTLGSKSREIEGPRYLAAITGNRRKTSFESGQSDEMIIKRTHQWTVQYDTTETAVGSAPSSTASGPEL